MLVHDKLYIDGGWRTPDSRATISVLNPATEQMLGVIPAGNENDVDQAVQAARGAFAAWRQTTPAERAGYLLRIAQGLEARAAEITELIARDIGMPKKMARRMQVGLPIAIYRSYAQLAREFAFEQRVGNSLVLREPLGVAACITPWNYPLFQIATKLGPALAAGCCVVLKPSEVAPLSTFILAEIIDAAGLPPGVVNLVTGDGVGAGEALVTHPQVNMISFTGSTRAGKRIGELAARDLKSVALELGGKSAAILLDDADFAQAVRATVNSCFLNSGQTCLALTRMLVPAARYAEAAALAIETARRLTLGDPLDDSTKLGPLASAQQRERVRAYIRRGIADGAELLCGGADAPERLAHGFYVRPTVFGRVDPASALAQEEIFGPVLSIIVYRDEDDAVRIANETPYGLAGAVWSGSEQRALRVARRLVTGQVDINGGPFNLLAPFGGWKQSGKGRELGSYGLEEFLGYKSLQCLPEAAPGTKVSSS
jgi:aldehyde dehydrogenase (NAD+)